MQWYFSCACGLLLFLLNFFVWLKTENISSKTFLLSCDFTSFGFNLFLLLFVNKCRPRIPEKGAWIQWIKEKSRKKLLLWEQLPFRLILEERKYRQKTWLAIVNYVPKLISTAQKGCCDLESQKRTQFWCVGTY